MEISAGRAQLITAERIWHDGQAHAGWGIVVNEEGRIASIGPLGTRSKSTLHFAQKILLPALVDPFAPGCWLKHDACADLAPHPAEPPPPGITLGIPRIDASQSQLYARLRAALLSRLRLGVVCVGVPHVLASHNKASAGKSPYPLADLMVAAAQDVGVRLAICAGPPTDCEGAACIDALHDDFRGLVAHIVSFADPRLSWALFVPEGEKMPLDALVSLKLRMAHLPLLLALDPLDVPVEINPASEASRLARLVLWHQAGLLDASTSVLVASEPAPAAAKLLASVGSTFIAMTGQPSPISLGAYVRGEGALGFGTMAEPRRERPASIWELAAWQRAAGAALGLRTPGWHLNRWADLMTLSWPQPTTSLCASDVLIAGQLVLREGRHRFDGFA